MNDDTHSRISRKGFLKMLFLFSAALGANFLLNLPGDQGRNKSVRYNNQQFAFAQTSGSWTLGKNTTTVAIHATLLPNGKILYMAGSGYSSSHQDGPYEIRVLDLGSGSETEMQLPDDIFCVGQAQLSNGNILFAGGTLRYDIASDNCNGKWQGLNVAYEYSLSSASFVKVTSMRHGRWYPTCVTLPDGRVFTVSGYDEYGDYNKLVEIYNPSTKSWSIKYDSGTSTTYCVGSSSKGICSGAGSPCYGSANTGVAPETNPYPRAHLMPSGLVVVCGMQKNIRTWNPSNGQWKSVGSSNMFRHYGTSILLPLQNTTSERGRILLVGGSPTSTDPATTKVEILDFNQGTSTSPIVRTVDSLHYARKWLLPMILPNGKAVVFGGRVQNGGNYVYVPEMFDPANETWVDLPPASVPRMYHSTALLLADGRVWTAGGTPTRTTWELRTEFFKPGYYSASNRPKISSRPTVGSYGGTITIPTLNAADINAVSLVRLSNTTHHYDTDQRMIWLQIKSKTSTSVTASAPINSKIAPPGYYLLHILMSGIPSKAWTVLIK